MPLNQGISSFSTISACFDDVLCVFECVFGCVWTGGLGGVGVSQRWCNEAGKCHMMLMMMMMIVVVW